MLARGDLGRWAPACSYVASTSAACAHRSPQPVGLPSSCNASCRVPPWQEVSDVDPATSVVRIDAATTISRFVGQPLADLSQILLTVFVIVIAAAAARNAADRSRAAGELTVGVTCIAVLLLVITWATISSPYRLRAHVFFYGVPHSGDAVVRCSFSDSSPFPRSIGWPQNRFWERCGQARHCGSSSPAQRCGPHSALLRVRLAGRAMEP